MLNFKIPSYNNSPYMLQTRPIENERDAFDRIRTMRKRNAIWSAIMSCLVLALLVLPNLFKGRLPDLREHYVMTAFFVLLVCNSVHDRSVWRRLVREDRYRARDVYSLFGVQLIVGYLIVGVVVWTLPPELVAAAHRHDVDGVLAILLVALIFAYFYHSLVMKTWRNYRSALKFLDAYKPLTPSDVNSRV
jgi:hypothetical protein